MLVDAISKLSPSRQKLLWLQVNKSELSELAEEIDQGVVDNNLTPEEINSLVQEAKEGIRKKKKA